MSRDRTVRTSGPRPLRRLLRSRLRLRVLIAAMLVALVALVAFDFAAVTALRGYLLSQTDASLRTAAQESEPQLATVLATPQTLKNIPEISAEAKAWLAAHQFVGGWYSLYYIADPGYPESGNGVEDGPLPPPEGYHPNMPVDLSDVIADGKGHNTIGWSGNQLRSVAVHAGHGTMVASTLLYAVDDTVSWMRLRLIIGSAVALLFIGLGVFWLLRRGLRPIETMAGQADRITAGDLADRVTEQDPRSEVGRLGSALNGMLARIEASVREREAGQELMRRFFADASHELRTPLASLRANAELYQQGALAERAQVDEVMRRIVLESRRMSGLVDDMLRLARLDQHPDQQCELVGLTDLVAGCVDRMRVAAPDHVWHTEITAGLVVVGDEELLRRAVDNLLANVLAHTPGETSATVALRDHGDTVEIEVSDTGPGVPPDGLPRIFDRFYRADSTSPRPGSGLGLAIVTEIVTVHNGTVVAEPNPLRGLRVRLTLPVAGPFALTRDSHDSPAVV